MERIEQAISNAIKYRKYNALIAETFDLARKQAKNALEKGQTPFAVAVKDCFATAGIQTSCASRCLHQFIAPYTATVVQKLYDSGGCLIGKANMDEFCMGTSSTKGYYGPVKNGLSSRENLDNDWYSAGGSSGGSAVAVQLGIATVALGSDTGGSSRNPAAFTGLFGFKPSYGTLSRHGLIPLVNSLDCPSIICGSAQECNYYFQMMCGHDPKDATSIDTSTSCFMNRRPLNTITVGIPKEYYNENLSPESWNAWNDAAKSLVDLGCVIKSVEMPYTEYSLICYHVLAEADIASNMARYDGIKYGYRSKCDKSTFALYAETRSESLNETVRRRILAGNFFLLKRHYDEYFGQALRVRRLIKMDFDRVFRKEGCDMLLAPVTSGTPPLFSELGDGGGYDRERIDDYYTQPSNMAGVPSITVPFLTTRDGLPVAVQLIADFMNDGIVLNVAHCLAQIR